MAEQTVKTADEMDGRPVYKKEKQDRHEGAKRRNITKIIIHCSDSLWGNFKHINDWHKERWSGINHYGKQIYCGYHYIVLNGEPEFGEPYKKVMDGKIEKGRPDIYIGAHCKGQNTHSLGICLIGKDKFTKEQRRSLSKLLDSLMAKYPRIEHIHPHNKYSYKTCPNLNVNEFLKKWVAAYYDF